jgi:hypothetical protein
LSIDATGADIIAVEEHPLYETWRLALTRLDQATEFHKIMLKKRGEQHLTTKQAKAYLDEAQAEYDAITDKL